jgi:hypothetical protein
MSIWPLPLAPNRSRIRVSSEPKTREAEEDLSVLLFRIRQRLYPESVPVLASYWLKAVYTHGHSRAWWGALNSGIENALRKEPLAGVAIDCLKGIQAWIREANPSGHGAPEAEGHLARPHRPDLAPEQTAAYVCRLLNEWLPGELARLLIEEPECAPSDDEGLPWLAAGKALERLLHREHFSPDGLHLLLEPEGLSPQYVYPAHAEILRDVLTCLLGQTLAPEPPVLPATLLGVAAGSALPDDYAGAVEEAFLIPGGGHEIHVPLHPDQALQAFRSDPVRIGSILVTMDGRWWQAEALQSGAETAVVYRPAGRLRIDFSADHAKLMAPCPETHSDWAGAVRLPQRVEIFGREWRARGWERNADGAWLHLEFVRALGIPDAHAPSAPRRRRLRPAFAEMAWSEMERALARCLAERSEDPIDELRRADLIPLARAIHRLVERLRRPSAENRAAIEQSLASIRYLMGAVAPVYGRIPWRVVPAARRSRLLKIGQDLGLSDFLDQTFEDAPGASPRAA